MKGFAAAISALSVAVLVYVYTVPMDSMRATRDGAPHFSPKVIHPETGEPVELGKLIRHFRGD